MLLDFETSRVSSLLADADFNFWTHPVGPAVALSGHGCQLGVQEVSGLVDALRGEEYKARSVGSSRLQACRVWHCFLLRYRCTSADIPPREPLRREHVAMLKRLARCVAHSCCSRANLEILIEEVITGQAIIILSSIFSKGGFYSIWNTVIL